MGTIKIGDVVCLKSGGPQMTVGNIEQIFDDATGKTVTIVTCDWIDSTLVPHKADYNINQLEVK